jgi:DNA-binding CsgD family transcriptional regulator
MFEAMGFEAFAQRSRGELLATGERASKRTGEVTEQLTPQETQVARLVAEGSSNRHVAAQLFISPNTVEYHLQKVFRKVGVSSRTQLARAVLDQPGGNAGALLATADAALTVRCACCGALHAAVDTRLRPIGIEAGRPPQSLATNVA